MLSTPFSKEIAQEYERLKKIIDSVPFTKREQQLLDGTGGKISIADLIAYQIGWGKCVIRWYEAGLNGKIPEMPGDGFSKWCYVEIAQHFYKKYRYDAASKQISIFNEVVMRIIDIVDREERNENLDRLGVWPWCTLQSGKAWPLRKWVQINTVTPYKKANRLIKSKL